MAEITPAAGKQQRTGVRRSKKLSTKVDLTPMVDLGFLLITFFVFTTSLTKPRSLHLDLPANGDSSKAANSVTLTIIPVAGNKVFYYHGRLAEALHSGLYGTTDFFIARGIGDVIRQKQKLLNASGRYTANDLIVIIKPDASASYAAVTAAFDEMLINKVAHYTLIDLAPAETDALTMLHVK